MGWGSQVHQKHIDADQVDPYGLESIDLHHQGVCIDWPEFLMVVAGLKHRYPHHARAQPERWPVLILQAVGRIHFASTPVHNPRSLGRAQLETPCAWHVDRSYRGVAWPGNC